MPVPTTPTPEIEELNRLGNEIAELSAHLEVANARLLDLIREFDARGGWGVQGARSCAHWLAWRLGIEGDPPLHGQQQTDALGLIADAALKHDLDPGPSGDRYQVVVHVDAAVRPTLSSRVSPSSRTGNASPR